MKRNQEMNISEEEVCNVLEKIKHPFIDCSLIKLGIIKNIELNENYVFVTFALPFPKIPIKDRLIISVKKSIEKLGLKVKEEVTVMTPEELQKFLAIEKENWKGGI